MNETILTGLTILICGTTVILVFGILFALILNAVVKPNTLDVKGPFGFPLTTESAKGIPFYIKRGRRIYETSYLEALATCSLTVIKMVKQGDQTKKNLESSQIITVSRSTQVDKLISDIHKHLLLARDDKFNQVKHFSNAQSSFNQLIPYNGSVSKANIAFESNQVKEESYVDYTKIYYLNARQPLIGSSELSTKLAADGTLSEATGKVEDSTLEKLISAIPISTVFDNIVGATTATDTSVQEASIDETTAIVSYEFKFEVNYQYLRHTLSQEYTRQSAKLEFDANGDPPTNCWCRRELVETTKKEEKEEAKEADTG